MALIDADPYSRRVIGCAIEVHRTLGPGLLESIYEAALCHELTAAGLGFLRQQRLSVIYKGFPLDCELRMDLVVGNTVVVEVKSVQALLPIHEAQLLTYLKVSGLRVGLLLKLQRTPPGRRHPPLPTLAGSAATARGQAQPSCRPAEAEGLAAILRRDEPHPGEGAEDRLDPAPDTLRVLRAFVVIPLPHYEATKVTPFTPPRNARSPSADAGRRR